jgi:hypothetical protein
MLGCERVAVTATTAEVGTVMNRRTPTRLMDLRTSAERRHRTVRVGR